MRKAHLLPLLLSAALLAAVIIDATPVIAADNVFTDNIGIGKTAPSARIDIRSAGTTAGLALRIADSSGAELLSVLDNGNVGLGTTAPPEKFTISGGNILQGAVYTPRITGYLVDATRLSGPYYTYVSGKYAYVSVSTGDRLTIVDVSNPASPKVTGSITDATRLNGAIQSWVSGRYAYVAALNGNGLAVVDVSNPASPVVTGFVTDATRLNIPTWVQGSGKYVYLTSYTGNSVTIVDVSNPSSPFVTQYVTDATRLVAASMLSLFGNGKYAAVACDGASTQLTIVDISNPASPFVTGRVVDATRLNQALSVYVSGKYAYVGTGTGDSVTIVDVSNPSSPFVTGYVTDATQLNNIWGINVAGKYAYAACYSGARITVVDVSNPAVSPVIVGCLNDATRLNAPASSFVSGKYLYASAFTGNSLSIVDISGIDSPTASIGNIATTSVNVAENADIKNNLSVGIGLNVGFGGILSAGPVAIVATHTGTLAVLDIRKPTSAAAAPIMQITSKGNVGIGLTSPVYQLQLSLDSAAKPTTNTWTNSSDIRLKKNIHDIDRPLEKMLALRGVEFEWKDPQGQGNFTGRLMGFIAQEAEQVFPYWVIKDDKGYESLNIIGFPALAVEAIRALKKENDEIRSLHKELESIVHDLGSKDTR